MTKGWKRESGRHKLARNGIKTTTAKNLKHRWVDELHSIYSSYDEWEHYSDMYGLANRLGYDNSKDAWDDNPKIQGGVNPDDYCVYIKGKKGWRKYE